jgi:hypothetical protein
LWGEDGRFGLGASGTLYRGGDGGTGFDLGMLYLVARYVRVGAAVANLGEPTVRGFTQEVRWRPGLTLHTPGDALALQVQAELAADRRGFAFGARADLGVAARFPVRLLVRLDTDRDLRREAIAFGLSVGALNKGAAVVTASGDLRIADAVSLHGASERPRRAPRRR